MVAPAALAVAAAVWLAVMIASRYVALASVTAAVTLPVAVHLVARAPGAVVGCAAAAVAVVIWRHRRNLVRLYRGEEPKLRLRRAS
jgi:glycerol-3-phosphate acyltransferase PlsY